MDGFVAAYRIGRGLGGLPNPLGYYDERDLPFAWNLADRYVLFDRFFSSARGGSVWNHLFAVTATPGNPHADELPSGGLSGHDHDLRPARGCRHPVALLCQGLRPDEHDRPPRAGRSRFPAPPGAAAGNAARACARRELTSHIVDMQDFYRDAQAGRLPAVSYIAPGGVSEHPPAKLVAGQTFVRSIVNELMRSPEWSSTAFVLTYDSWGGWYDHVRPPKVDRYGYGFRVPALLVSPYARRGAIDHDTLDSTSILRFIEDNWQLAPLARRDANAHSIATAFDFSQPPRAPAFIPAIRASPAVATAHTRAVFWAYGGAALLALALTATAPAVSRRRPATRGGRATAEPGSARPLPSRPRRRQPWERLPGEPDAAWRAFVLYRDMGPGSRSQRALGAALRLEPAGAPPNSRMRQWSVDWRWVERCRAYDSYAALEVSR